jgi:hypothetical protein
MKQIDYEVVVWLLYYDRDWACDVDTVHFASSHCWIRVEQFHKLDLLLLLLLMAHTNIHS